jgi:hypothetical protein
LTHPTFKIYLPYSIHVNEIREVWRFVHYICAELPEERPAENEMIESIREIKRDIKDINQRLGNHPNTPV